MEQKEIEAPKVFVSHASEDKDRFVLAFATKLFDNGINAWVDKWEMKPGDKLIDKIFEVGIGGAQAILIILSRNSVEKPWVREELNAGVVERIKKGTKIIPLVLDDCAIPVALQSTLYERIPDLNDYDTSLKSIVDAIYEHSDKPPLGTRPSYIQTPVEKVLGLKKIDNILLKMAGDKEIENDDIAFVSTEEMLDKATSQGISRYNFFESLVVLEHKHYVKLHVFLGGEPSEPEIRALVGGGVSSLVVTDYGFEQYAKAYIPNYETLQNDVMLQIVNHNQNDSRSIADALQQPPKVIKHVIEELGRRKYLHIIQEFGSTLTFINVSPELRRLVGNF